VRYFCYFFSPDYFGGLASSFVCGFMTSTGIIDRLAVPVNVANKVEGQFLFQPDGRRCFQALSTVSVLPIRHIASNCSFWVGSLNLVRPTTPQQATIRVDCCGVAAHSVRMCHTSSGGRGCLKLAECIPVALALLKREKLSSSIDFFLPVTDVLIGDRPTHLQR
jgi:hypothetical protein